MAPPEMDDSRTEPDGTSEPAELETTPAERPKVHRIRMLLVGLGLGVIAVISLSFGALTAVSSDLPKLESRQEYQHSKNSVLFDVRGKELGVLTGPNNVYLAAPTNIAPSIKHSVIAIEDRRFYENSGFDLRGIGRALWSDVASGSPVQGASTISQQFVKNALDAENKRTVLEKLREAVLAYHLNRRWSKEKILTEYLNTIYFGQGAYGIESAARVYFGKAHPGCGTSVGDQFCAADLDTAEAAMIAGIIASPTGFDPIAHPVAARNRRDTVLRAMHQQKFITDAELQTDLARTIPDQTDITPPQQQSLAPYFTTWVQSLLVNRLGATRAFTGGLKIRTTLDLDLQRAAEQAVNEMLPPDSGLPSASMVVIDNKTSEVRAMVGGSNYSKQPFNLATQGHRQPGSAFKPFTLAMALTTGISANSVWESRKKIFPIPNTRPQEYFIVNNYDDSYAGSRSLADAMTSSDNSVYAEVGIKVGTPRIARMANHLGIRSPVSSNYSMTLGGLREGVTPLDMAHAYETFATGGVRIDSANGLGGLDGGPVGILSIDGPQGKRLLRNKVNRTRVISGGVASTVKDVLQTVVSSGTGKEAQIGGFAAGKTGTTENYGDAWFVGWNDRYTVAVWVGYPDKLRPMKTEYGGSPVAGGTFPASIWRQFMLAAMAIDSSRDAAKAAGKSPSDAGSSTSSDSSGYGPGSSSGGSGSAGASGGNSGGSADTGTGGSGQSGGGGGGGGNTGGDSGSGSGSGGGNGSSGGDGSSGGGSGGGGSSGGSGVGGGAGPSG